MKTAALYVLRGLSLVPAAVLFYAVLRGLVAAALVSH